MAALPENPEVRIVQTEGWFGHAFGANVLHV